MRSLRVCLIVVISFLFLWSTFALFTPESFIKEFDTVDASLGLSAKKPYYLKVYSNLGLLAIRNRYDAEQVELYTTLKTYVRQRLDRLSSWSSFAVIDLDADTGHASSLVISGMSIPGVDLNKVREVRLSLHNTERTTKSLTPYVYDYALEWTATTWSEYLADLGRTTHKRKSWDGYYSYASIKSWFQNQGISFATKEKNGQTLFTENIWRNIYSCKKTDCTQDFIKAIKKSWTFFMNEKWKSYRPHYNAIVGHFARIGLWVALSGNKYYLVTHYSQALK